MSRFSPSGMLAVFVALASFCALCFADSDRSVEELFRLAKSAEESGDYSGAAGYYDHILRTSQDAAVKKFLSKKISDLKKTTKAPVPSEYSALKKSQTPKPAPAAKPSATQTAATSGAGTAAYYSEARKYEEAKDYAAAADMYKKILGVTTDSYVISFLDKKISELNAMAKKQPYTPSPSTAAALSRPAMSAVSPASAPQTAPARKEPAFVFPPAIVIDEATVEKKIQNARYLLGKGDELYKAGQFEEAFKMYKVAVEAL